MSPLNITIDGPTLGMLFIAFMLRSVMLDFHKGTPFGSSIDNEHSGWSYAIEIAILWWVLHLFYWLVRWQ